MKNTKKTSHPRKYLYEMAILIATCLMMGCGDETTKNENDMVQSETNTTTESALPDNSDLGTGGNQTVTENQTGVETDIAETDLTETDLGETNHPIENAIDEAGNTIDNTMDSVGDGINEIADDAGNLVNDAMDDTGNAINNMTNSNTKTN